MCLFPRNITLLNRLPCGCFFKLYILKKSGLHHYLHSIFLLPSLHLLPPFMLISHYFIQESTTLSGSHTLYRMDTRIKKCQLVKFSEKRININEVKEKISLIPRNLVFKSNFFYIFSIIRSILKSSFH